MKTTGKACSLLLLTMVAVSSGRNAREYFQQARFRHFPANPENAIVFFAASAPPLICELEKDGDWVGGDRIMADLILSVRGSSPFYMCSFEGNTTTQANLKLIQKSLPGVFTSNGKRRIDLSFSQLNCLDDSYLPDDYFQLRVQRPNEERPMKCRLSHLDKRLYLRFPGFPAIICRMFESHRDFDSFNLPRIVGSWSKCAFQVYLDLPTRDKNVEKRLYSLLVSKFFIPSFGSLPNVACYRHEPSARNVRFQIRIRGDMIYDCFYSGI